MTGPQSFILSTFTNIIFYTYCLPVIDKQKLNYFKGRIQALYTFKVHGHLKLKYSNVILRIFVFKEISALKLKI